MQPVRGAIYNRDRSKQSYDFTGLCFGNITPTDIDGLIEYKNRAYIIIEIKYGDNEVPLGQKLALERLTDDLERSGKPTFTIIASHNISNSKDDIDVANTIVRMYRFKGSWIKPNLITTKKLIEYFISTLCI